MVDAETYQHAQVLSLTLKWLVLWAFGGAIIAYQLKKRQYPRWPMPGAWVGAAFLIIDGVLPLHMALNRLGWLPWTLYSFPGTFIICFIAINSVLALGRWWNQGFEDTPGPWQGGKPVATTTGYQGEERRVNQYERRAVPPPLPPDTATPPKPSRRFRFAVFLLIVAMVALIASSNGDANTDMEMDCADFTSQSDASQYIGDDDPYDLDRDGDGIACESLPK